MVNQLLSAQSQKIVNSAQITGDAFRNLLTTFPQLAGVVRQFGDAADAAASLDDRLFKAVNDTSHLAERAGGIRLRRPRRSGRKRRVSAAGAFRGAGQRDDQI